MIDIRRLEPLFVGLMVLAVGIFIAEIFYYLVYEPWKRKKEDKNENKKHYQR